MHNTQMRCGKILGTQELRTVPTESDAPDNFYLEIITSPTNSRYAFARLEITDHELMHKEIVLVNQFGTIIEKPGLEYPLRYNLTAQLKLPIAERLLELMQNGKTYRLSTFRKLGFKTA